MDMSAPEEGREIPEMVSFAEIARRVSDRGLVSRPITRQGVRHIADTDPEWPVPREQWQKIGIDLRFEVVTNALGPSARDFSLLAPHSPSRNTAMIDFSPSEYSRFRLQFARDKSRATATDNVILLQYIHSLGQHGAHRF